MKFDEALAMKVEAPKSLTSVSRRRQQYYTPVPQKLHGYAQMPRQTVMPYQNETDYQKLLKRHMDRGQTLQSFDFPPTQGKQLRNKTEQTEAILYKYSSDAENKKFGVRMGLKLTKPDYVSGFKD